MSPRLYRNEIVDRVLKGIAAAHKDYYHWSGGEWLWRAPEYLQTVYVARTLAKGGNCFVTLEDSLRDTLQSARATGPGRPSIATRVGGRTDIVLWWAGGTPRGVIEAKRDCSRYADIEADVGRIKGILTKNVRRSSFEFGAISFYTSFGHGKRKIASDRVSDALTRIVDGRRMTWANDSK